tara:strand:+ start:725 stop:934 length:210 start_codon:yes stop_codon:yes gene_type:complete
VKVGDLVKNTQQPEHGIGIVLQIDIDMWGQVHEPAGVKVLWRNPTWHDPEDGASIMYSDEVEVISEGGR